MTPAPRLLNVPAYQPSATGFVQRAGRPRLKGHLTSSIRLTPQERELLERLAVLEDAHLAEVWRSALHHYAELRGFLPNDAGGGVSAAA